MNNCLKLTLEPDNDGTAELHAAVQSKGFSGASSARFSIRELEKFSDQLLTYPLPPEGIAPLRGGSWSMTTEGKLDEPHVVLKVYPVGPRGAVGCLVNLRTTRASNATSEVESFVEVELRTSYEALTAFSGRLKKLLRSEIREAVLDGAEI